MAPGPVLGCHLASKLTPFAEPLLAPATAKRHRTFSGASFALRRNGTVKEAPARSLNSATSSGQAQAAGGEGGGGTGAGPEKAKCRVASSVANRPQNLGGQALGPRRANISDAKSTPGTRILAFVWSGTGKLMAAL